MIVKTKSSDTKIDEFFKRVANRIKEAILNELMYIGEGCDELIRSKSQEESWINRTGNLRSSIGYAVYDHGMMYMRGLFDQVMAGSVGQAEGERMTVELAQTYSDTIALAVIAAMDYADIVEAIDSKDVLESTRILVFNSVEKKLQDALERVMAEINTWEL